MRHFKLTEEKKFNFLGIELTRIELTIDCKWGLTGKKGGWVEKEENLCDEAWCDGNAQIFGNARVSDKAYVFNNAMVFGDSKVFDEAKVLERSLVYGYSKIYEKAVVRGGSIIFNYAEVFGNALIDQEAKIFQSAKICGNARIMGNSEIYGNAIILGNAEVLWYSEVFQDTFDKSPFQIQGTKDFLNECKKGYLKIGSKNFTFEEWKDKFENFHKFENHCYLDNYYYNEVKEYLSYVNLAISFKK
jgi:carbonic anhydrase/acetyltransferase-like protein (isoleucine patch superfamily)